MPKGLCAPKGLWARKFEVFSPNSRNSSPKPRVDTNTTCRGWPFGAKDQVGRRIESGRERGGPRIHDSIFARGELLLVPDTGERKNWQNSFFPAGRFLRFWGGREVGPPPLALDPPCLGSFSPFFPSLPPLFTYPSLLLLTLSFLYFIYLLLLYLSFFYLPLTLLP